VEDEKKSNVWITALKLVALAVFIIGGVGAALWFAAHDQRFDEPNKPPNTPANSWGIVNDSPIRPKN